MRERVLAIVSLLAQYFLEEREPKSEHELVEELLAIGFGAEEIDAAFLWLEDEALRPPAADHFTAPLLSQRVFAPDEERALSCEARGFLLRVRSLGIVDEELFEELVARAAQTAEEEIPLREIKTITVLTLFARTQQQWRQEYDYLLEDDWSRLLN